MLGMDSLRAFQRVDYSGYVGEDDDEENIMYEDNTIPHKKPLLPVSHYTLIYGRYVEIHVLHGIFFRRIML